MIKGLFSCLVVFVLTISMAGCSGNEGVEYVEKDGRWFYSCDLDKANAPTSNLKLSSIAEKPKVVFFDTSPESIFGFWRCTISDNYIGICPSSGRFKLFDHDGRFLRGIGDVGHGPGEYTKIYEACIDEKNGYVYLGDMGTRKILKYTIDGEFLCVVNVGRPISKCALRCREDGTLEVVNMPFGMGDYQFMVAGGMSAPTYYPAKMEVPTRDENGNFIGFNNEIWTYGNSGLMTYKLSCSDTLYAFDSSDGSNYPLVTAQCENKVYFMFNETSKYLFIDTLVDPKVIWRIDRSNGKLAKGEIENDYLYGMSVNNPIIKFRNGWYCDFYDSYDLESELETLEKEGNLGKEELSEIRQLKEKVQASEQGVMLLGKLK